MMLNLTACASYPGTDGNTYYWLKPLPIHHEVAVPNSPQTTTHFYQVNGRSFQVTTFGTPRGR